MTKIRLFINTCAISTLAASHPAYNSGTNLGMGPTAVHPAYNSGSSAELGMPHPGYNFGDDLGASNPHNTTQEGARIADELLQKPSVVLTDNPEVLKVKYPKDEGTKIDTPSKIDLGVTPAALHPAYNSGDSKELVITPAASHPAYNSGDSKEPGITPAAVHPAYNSGDSKDLGMPHPGYNFGDDLGVPNPHTRLTDASQKPSLVLPDNPEVLKVKYPKDEGATIGTPSKTDLGITPAALHPAYNSGDSKDLGIPHPGYNFGDDLGVPNPQHTQQQSIELTDELLQKPSLVLPDNPEVLKVKYPKDEGATIDKPTLIDNHGLDQDLGVHRPASPKIDIHDLDQDLGVHRPAPPIIDIHDLDQGLGVPRPTAPKIEIDADGSGKASDTPCSKIVKKFTLIQNPGVQNATSKGRSGSIGSRAAAAGNAVSAATDAGEAGDNAQFRFGLSPDQIKLSIRKKMHFREENDGSVYSNTLNALEKTLDSTQAIRKNGKGMTFWVSGIYAQGATDSIFGSPASTDKHYGIIVGTHYKHEPTQQIFGVAFDVGTGRSIAKTNKDQKTDTKMAQLTLYYNKMLSKNWKFNLCNSFMNEWEHHQRPFIDNAGVQQIAISNSIDQEFTSNIGIGYKQEFSRDNYLEPFFSFNYTFTKQYAHREKNVADGNAYNSNSSDQIGLQFGIKSSFGTELSNSKTFVVMPKVSYTNFAKMSKFTQKSVNISSGQVSMSQSGTPGRHLLSATIAVGVDDYHANTTTRIAYTGNVQKQRRSHEVMVDWSIKF